MFRQPLCRAAVQNVAGVGMAVLAGGLFLTAVMKARAEGAKVKTVYNLMQIGLANQNFHDQFLRFPGAGVQGGDELPNPRTSMTAPWHYQILPFIDQDALYRLPDRATADNPVVVKPYLDPDRKRTGHVSGRPVTDYAANLLALYGSVNYADLKEPQVKFGTLNLATVTDGSTNTILAGPKAMKPGEYNAADKDPTFLSQKAAGLSLTTARYTAGVKAKAKQTATDFTPGAYQDADPKLPDGPTDLFGNPQKPGVAFVFLDCHVHVLSYGWLAPDNLLKERQTVAQKFGDPEQTAERVSQYRAALTPQSSDVFQLPAEGFVKSLLPAPAPPQVPAPTTTRRPPPTRFR